MFSFSLVAFLVFTQGVSLGVMWKQKEMLDYSEETIAMLNAQMGIFGEAVGGEKY